MPLELKSFDIADYLTNDETIAAYLTEALEGDDPLEIVQAFADVARAKGGLAQLAHDTGISVAELTRALDVQGNLDLKTLIKLVHAFGMKMSFSSSLNEPVAA
jgi:probable addiction module antidote protein